MYLSRLELLPEAARNPRFWADLQDLYGAHQAIWQLFADRSDRKRDFLFRKEGEGAGSRWFTLSERAPRDERGFWKVESKRFDPQLRTGDRLHFLVRVNPVVAKSREGRRSARHDVVMSAKRSDPDSSRAKPEAVLVTETCTAWLSARAARNGFEVDPVEIAFDGYRQHGTKRGGVRLSTVDIEGVLTVRDPSVFLALLKRGLGPAKSFGCGLALIRRA